MNKILVTGGAGFIGSNFITYIRKMYPKSYIVSLDKLAYNSDSENYKTIKGDISDRKFIFDLFEKEKFDIVVNCTNESDVEKYAEEQSIFIITNIIGTQNLLDACREFNVNRYHHISTLKVDCDFKMEKTPSYIASRLAGELLVNAYKKEYDLKCSISREEVNDNNILEYYQNIDKEIHKKII